MVEAAVNQLQYEAVLVKVANPSPAAQAQVSQALAGFPQLTVKTTAQYVNQQKQQVQGFLRFVYVLLAFSIIIGLIGVINTLLLSVLERTHEIGLLRAVGMMRRQVRSMIRGEAVVVSLLGAVLGVGLWFTGQLHGWVPLYVAGALLMLGVYTIDPLVYAYTTELFPTRMRAWATMSSSAWRAVAAVVAPVVIGLILQVGLGIEVVFGLFAVVLALGLAAQLVWGVETKQAQLERLAS